jgi:hypothetical protein
MKKSTGKNVVSLAILIVGLTIGTATSERAYICLADTSFKPLTTASVDEAVVIIRGTFDAIQTAGDSDKLLKFHTKTTIKGQHRASWTVVFSRIVFPEIFDSEFSDLVGKEVIVGLATAPVDQPAAMVAGERCGPKFIFAINVPDEPSVHMAEPLAEKGLLPLDVTENMNRRLKLIDDAKTNRN